MGNTAIKPQNLPEKVVWYYLTGTFVAYYLGLQFLLTPLLGYFLLFLLLKQLWQQTDETPASEKIVISPSVWVWVIAMLMIEVTIVISHINFNLGLTQIIRTSVGWSRQWALLALFPLAGHLKIRPQIIYRAVCILAPQCLVVVAVDTLAALVRLPVISFFSPFKILGGGNALWEVEFFSNAIMRRNDFKLFAGWPTILGMISVIYVYCAWQETDPKWRRIGVFTYLFLIFASQTRTAIACLIITFVLWQVLNYWSHPRLLFVAAFSCSFIGILLPKLTDWFNVLKDFVENFRGKDSADSGQLRGYINRMTLARWQSDAPIWGHGVIAEFGEGPRITQGIPLGTHSTWFAILYNHGLVGFMSLLIAFLYSFFHLFIKSIKHRDATTAKIGLMTLIVLAVFGFTEPIQVWAYVYWSLLLMLGIALSNRSTVADELWVRST